MATRGERNNNPGNIRLNPNIHWVGQIAGTDSAFVSYDTPSDGIRALAKVLLSYQEVHGLKTVLEIINRWAPSGENDTGAYVNDVAIDMGVSSIEPIDLTEITTLASLVTAIIRHENGECIYDDTTILNATQEALQ